MLRVADDFLNIRGSFKVGGLIDIGTQCSLVRRASGRFVFLDSYALSAAAQRPAFLGGWAPPAASEHPGAPGRCGGLLCADNRAPQEERDRR